MREIPQPPMRAVVGYSIAVLPSILFYFFVLYVAGALVNHFVDNTEEEENDDMVEDEEIAPL